MTGTGGVDKERREFRRGLILGLIAALSGFLGAGAGALVTYQVAAAQIEATSARADTDFLRDQKKDAYTQFYSNLASAENLEFKMAGDANLGGPLLDMSEDMKQLRGLIAQMNKAFLVISIYAPHDVSKAASDALDGHQHVPDETPWLISSKSPVACRVNGCSTAVGADSFAEVSDWLRTTTEYNQTKRGAFLTAVQKELGVG